MKCLYVFLALFCFSKIYASEKVDSFVVRFYSNKVVVLSPSSVNENLSIIIENKTLSKLVGRIEDEKERVKENISIPANTTVSEHLEMRNGEKLFFLSLSPAFQAVPLIIGSKPYEIPPKAKDK